MKAVAILIAVFGVVAAQSLTANPEECKICEFAMGILEAKLANNKTDAAIIAELGNLCDDLPSAYHDECKALVVRYGGEAIKYFKHTTPAQFCALVGVCQASSEVQSRPRVQESGEECKFCTAALSWIRSKVSSKGSEAEIQEELTHLCNDLPTLIGRKCLVYVEKYTPLLVKMIQQDLKPTLVCQEMHMCPNTFRRRF